MASPSVVELSRCLFNESSTIGECLGKQSIIDESITVRFWSSFNILITARRVLLTTRKFLFWLWQGRPRPSVLLPLCFCRHFWAAMHFNGFSGEAGRVEFASQFLWVSCIWFQHMRTMCLCICNQHWDRQRHLTVLVRPNHFVCQPFHCLMRSPSNIYLPASRNTQELCQGELKASQCSLIGRHGLSKNECEMTGECNIPLGMSNKMIPVWSHL